MLGTYLATPLPTNPQSDSADSTAAAHLAALADTPVFPALEGHFLH